MALAKKKRNVYKIILHNDNVNTFDRVIYVLTSICGFNHYQAVQCATLANNNKSYEIFERSDKEYAQEICKSLKANGLNTELLTVSGSK